MVVLAVSLVSCADESPCTRVGEGETPRAAAETYVRRCGYELRKNDRYPEGFLATDGQYVFTVLGAPKGTFLHVIPGTGGGPAFRTTGYPMSGP